MKKIETLTALLFLAVSLSCSSGGDDPEPQNTTPVDNPDPGTGDTPDDTEPDALSYQSDIQPIFSSNCTSCHGDPPTQNAPMSMVTLEQIQEAVENRGLLDRINNNANPMPPTGLLPLSTRELIEEWVEQGYPE